MTPAREQRLSVARDSERRVSRGNLASIGIHVQERGESRSAQENQVRRSSGGGGGVQVLVVDKGEDHAGG